MATSRTRPKPGAAKSRSKGSGLVLSGLPRVNLLPAKEIERRATTALAKRWMAGVAATALVVSAVVAGAHWVRATAAVQLLAEQNRTETLNAELAGLAGVSALLDERSELATLRSESMGNDLEWQELVDDITAALPKGTEIRSFDLITGANPVGDADPAATIGLIGRLSLWSEDGADLERLVANLRTLDITLSADAAALTAEAEDGFTFSVEFVVDQTHYSGRFAAAGGAR